MYMKLYTIDYRSWIILTSLIKTPLFSFRGGYVKPGETVGWGMVWFFWVEAWWFWGYSAAHISGETWSAPSWRDRSGAKQAFSSEIVFFWLTFQMGVFFPRKIGEWFQCRCLIHCSSRICVYICVCQIYIYIYRSTYIYTWGLEWTEESLHWIFTSNWRRTPQIRC